MLFFRLLLLFTLIPVVELMLLIEIGRRIGTGPTILIVLLTGLFGAAMARSQGSQVLRDIRWDMEQGQVPADGLIQGVLILIGGLFLLTPGIVTDVVGLFLVLPPTRRRIIVWLRRLLIRWTDAGTFRLYFRR